jgi:lichenan operon transcriptional antiterminator
MIKEGVIENDELKMTVEISNKLEKLYDFEYNEIELEELQTILIGNILVTNSREVDKINLKSLVGKKTIDLVKEMMDDVKEYYYFSEINTDFLTRFSLHVNNLLTRLEINYVNKNPLTNNIKYSCPLLFDCGVKMSHTIYKRTGLQVTDDEIALMVLHLGTLIEEWENDKKKVNGAIIISGYQKVYSDLIEKIEKNFSGINIKRIYSNFEEYQKGSKNDHFDMIITTLPSSNPISDAVNITPFLTETDSKKIDEKIEEVRVAKEKGHLRDLLGEVTDKAFFRKNSECREKNTIIKQLCTDFVEKNITSDTFTEEVLKREELSSTAFGRIAVPHSFNMDANKTMISISIYEKPITWEGKEVNVVFLFAVNDTKKRVFQEIFDNLIIKLADLPDIDRLANSRHYEEFIENLLSLLN